MNAPHCHRHDVPPVPARTPIFERHGDVIILNNPQGVIMFHHIDELPEPVDRLRRRDLVAAIAERLDLDDDGATGLMDAIETVIEGNAERHEIYAILPRVGAVEARPGGFRDLALTVVRDYVPVIGFSSEIAAEADLTVDEVELALAIITKMVESAPESAAVYVPGWGYHGPDDALDRVEQQNRRELVDYYREHPATTWVLQCNPAKWDVYGFIDETGELPWSWSISRYRDQIAEGDRVVFWLAGPEGGVYAIGEVTGPPQFSHVDTDHLGDDTNHSWEWFVPIDLDLDLFDEPVLRTDLKVDPSFTDEPIIRAPWAANPHPLSNEAFNAILDRLGDPVAPL